MQRTRSPLSCDDAGGGHTRGGGTPAGGAGTWRTAPRDSPKWHQHPTHPSAPAPAPRGGRLRPAPRGLCIFACVAGAGRKTPGAGLTLATTATQASSPKLSRMKLSTELLIHPIMAPDSPSFPLPMAKAGKRLCGCRAALQDADVAAHDAAHGAFSQHKGSEPYHGGPRLNPHVGGLLRLPEVSLGACVHRQLHPSSEIGLSFSQHLQEVVNVLDQLLPRDAPLSKRRLPGWFPTPLRLLRTAAPQASGWAARAGCSAPRR